MIQCLKAAALMAVTILCLCAVVVLGTINRSVKNFPQSATARKLYDTVASVNAFVGNTDHRLNKDGGLLQATQKAVNGYKAVAVEAALAEKKYSTMMYDRGTVVFDNLDTITGTVKTQLPDLLTGLGGLETALTNTLNTGVIPTLDQLRRAIASVDKNLLQDQDIQTILAELAKTTEHVDQSTDHVQHMIEFMDKKLTGPTTLKGKVMGALSVIYKIAVIDAVLHK